MKKIEWLSALKEIDPRGGSYMCFILSIILGGSLSFYISNTEKTIDLVIKTTDILLTVEIGIFAAFFTVYSLVITFLQKKFLRHLLSIREISGYDYISNIMSYVGKVAYLYCLSIWLTMILKITLSILDKNWSCFDNQYYNVWLATILLGIFYAFVFRVILELDSIIHNAMLILDGNIQLKISEIQEGDLDD